MELEAIRLENYSCCPMSEMHPGVKVAAADQLLRFEPVTPPSIRVALGAERSTSRERGPDLAIGT
jgi:hypothetical protein